MKPLSGTRVLDMSRILAGPWPRNTSPISGPRSSRLNGQA
ncbi:CoA transferase [Seohaeicola saemankumensis]|nr:CoA transferase [Seohaeicola saemankumensis]